jgi:hypothetical protein
MFNKCLYFLSNSIQRFRSGKAKGKFVPLRTMKAYMENRSIAPLILDIGPK